MALVSLYNSTRVFDGRMLKPGDQPARARKYGVGMIFFPKDSALKKASRKIIAAAVEKLGFELLGYRKLNVDSSVIGETARQAEPDVRANFCCRPRA
jgi:glutamate synthase (NADPH/NADH) large chain